MAKGCDYSFDKPSAASLQAAGYKFACRYVGGSPGKRITASEARTLWAHGIDVVTNFEAVTTGPLNGHGQGVTDAHTADAQHRAAGGPAGKPIYFSVDFDVQPHQMATVVAYLQGVTSVLGVARTGVYGGLAVVSWALNHGLVRYAWQTYAWSSGVWDKRAHIQQYHNNVAIGGGKIDLDRSMTADFGAWHGPQTASGATGPTEAIGAVSGGSWDPVLGFVALGIHLDDLGNGFANYTGQINNLRK